MGPQSNTSASKTSSRVAWSSEFNAISDLTSTSAGVTGAVTINESKYLVGLDSEGRLIWRIENDADPLLIAKECLLYALMDRRIISIDSFNGVVVATREIDPPLGGWSKANAIFLGDDLLLADSGGLQLLAATNLETKWKLAVHLNSDDAIQQLAHNPPWFAAISNKKVMLFSEQGELRWQRELPQGTRIVGSYPLIFVSDRLLVGLARTVMPNERFLYELSLRGEHGTEMIINDLAMFCPSHVSQDVLVLDTSTGLAGFKMADTLQRWWSIDVSITLGVCVTRGGDILVSAWRGTLLRVAFESGQSEVLLRLPEKTVWIPPAPNLEPGRHSESTGVIEHLAVSRNGIAFSVTWSKDQAAIQFIEHSWN